MAKRKVRNQIVNLTLTTKSRKLPLFPCVQVVCYIPLKSFQQGLQLFFRPHLNERFAHKVIGLQNCRNFNFENFGTPNLKDRGQNDTWVMAHGHARRIIYWGRWWFPPSLGCDESCEFMFARGSFMQQKCSNYALTNLLFGFSMSM